MKPIIFLVVWTSVAGLFAWLGYNQLATARSTGKFQYLWHGIGEDNWPLLFSALKIFLIVWICTAVLMTAIGCVGSQSNCSKPFAKDSSP